MPDINVKKNKMKTHQETFNTVAAFLLKQGPARDEYGCLYRGPNNTKCAAGCLIPDDKYEKRFDLGGYFADSKPIAFILESEGHDPLFVRKLQFIHDGHSINWSHWKNTMIEFAEANNLSTKVFE